MTNTQIIDVELSRPGWQANIFAVAGDMYSRYIEVHLYNGGQPYEPPSGTTCMIGWWRNDTEFGSYNSVMTDDHSTRQAWSIDGNVVTIELNWQIAQKAGKVGVNVALIGTDGSRISTWEMLCDVQRGPVAEADDPTLPSESATNAANRAEKAAKDAAASAGQAAASAGKVDAALEELDGILADGPVVSVNGKTGRVTLTAADVQALGLPAAPVAGQLLVIKDVGEDGSITVGTAAAPAAAPLEPVVKAAPPSGSYALSPGVLYDFTQADASALTFTFTEPEAGKAAAYHVMFKCGSTAATVTLPESVIKPEDFAVEANKIYEVSICENLMLVQSWGVA